MGSEMCIRDRSNGQAEDAVRGGKLETVDCGVVRDDGLLSERELLELRRVEYLAFLFSHVSNCS